MRVFFLMACAAGLSAAPNAPLDRAYTLLNGEPALLEREQARQIRSSGGISNMFPRSCVSAVDSSRICGDRFRLVAADSAKGRFVGFSPVTGLEYRDLDERAGAFDFGLVSEGVSGPASFRVDARMFTEIHEDRMHPSYDREFVERQDEQASGTAAYSSYSRYRSDLNYDFDWGRITAARDAAHWGPGLIHNLVFNQASIPFNQLAVTAHLGPFSVRSLYGQMALDTNWEGDSSGEHRSVYAHRYEWRFAQNAVLGISEQLVLHKAEAPFAFVPVVPLFIAKAGEKEQLNNGNISADLLWRISGRGALYAEFLLDDIQSPTSLFNDHWGNKWAVMAGAHGFLDFGSRTAGLIMEVSRLEPWVYTHKVPRGSQSAHFGQPLGNPLGPNSQAVTAKVYLRKEESWYLSARLDLTWKGTDLGSQWLDIHDGSTTRKTFLDGVDEPRIRFEPYAWKRLGQAAVHARMVFGQQIEAVARISYQY
jgi:hypothetical protein